MSDHEPTAADHLPAAADCLEDAMTCLNRASQASDSDAVLGPCDRMYDVVGDEASVLRELAINAEVVEEADGDE